MADAAAGKADFLLGQKYQAAKQWGPAAKAYLQTLKDDPQAYWAYKALGTVYYQAGDKRGALAYYDRYLALNPKDTATKAFADSLRAQQGGQAPATQAAAAPRATRDHGGFSLRLDGGAVMNDGSDVASLFDASAPGGMAIAIGVGADYALEGGFVAGLDVFYGPNRAYDISGAGSMTTYHWAINNIIVGVSPGWRFKLAKHWLIEPRLELGYMMSSGTITDNMGDPSVSTSASGLEYWPQVRGEYIFGNWGVGADLGYLIASLSPVTSDGANITKSGSNWVETNGGVSFAVYGAYHFNPPF